MKTVISGFDKLGRPSGNVKVANTRIGTECLISNLQREKHERKKNPINIFKR